MIYKDKEFIPFPTYEKIFWAIYKELIVLLHKIGLADMEEETFDWHKIILCGFIFAHLFIIWVLMAIACVKIILL